MKTYREFIQEIFNYRGELTLVHPEFHPKVTKGKEDLETWHTNIGKNDYRIQRYKSKGAYSIDFFRKSPGGGYSLDTPIDNTADASKIVSTAKKLVQEKLDQGQPVRITGSREQLTNLYEKIFHRMNHREYDGKLHVHRKENTIHLTHYPLPNTPEEIRDTVGLHHILDNARMDSDRARYIVGHKGHLLDNDSIDTLLSIEPSIGDIVIKNHLDKMRDDTIGTVLANDDSIDREGHIDHILDNARPDQIGSETQGQILYHDNDDQIRRLIGKVDIVPLHQRYLRNCKGHLYERYISEIFNYQGELTRDDANSTPNDERWTTNIGGNKYEFHRYKGGKGEYSLDFYRNDSMDKPDETTPEVSKVFSITKRLLQDKLNQGHVVSVTGARPELSDFYHRMLTKMNDREYGGRLIIQRDHDTTTVKHHPDPKRINEIQDTYGLHVMLDKLRIPTDLTAINQILRDKGHLLDGGAVAKIHNNSNSGEITDHLLDNHLDKASDQTLTSMLQSFGIRHNFIETKNKFNEIIDNPAAQIGNATKHFFISKGNYDLTSRLMDKVHLGDFGKLQIIEKGDPRLCNRIAAMPDNGDYVLRELSNSPYKGVVETLLKHHGNNLTPEHLNNIRTNFPEIQI